MNYNKLYYFYIITECAGLFEASERLCISQPALSKTVRDLEDFFNVKLFERSGRSLKLTSAGTVLKNECANIFQHENSIIKNMHAAASHETVNLKFGYMLYKELFHLVPTISKFNQTNPLIHIESLPYTERINLNADLLSEKVDIGLRIFTPEEIIPELNYKVLEETHLSIIACDKHHLAKKHSLHLSDLKNENFIFLGNDGRSSEYRFALEWCQKCGFEPNITSSFDWIGAVLLMVQSGLGISILSDFAPLAQMKGLVSIPLENSPLICSGLFWRKSDNRQSIYRFLDYYISNRI